MGRKKAEDIHIILLNKRIENIISNYYNIPGGNIINHLEKVLICYVNCSFLSVKSIFG